MYTKIFYHDYLLFLKECLPSSWEIIVWAIYFMNQWPPLWGLDVLRNQFPVSCTHSLVLFTEMLNSALSPWNGEDILGICKILSLKLDNRHFLLWNTPPTFILSALKIKLNKDEKCAVLLDPGSAVWTALLTSSLLIYDSSET